MHRGKLLISVSFFGIALGFGAMLGAREGPHPEIRGVTLELGAMLGESGLSQGQPIRPERQVPGSGFGVGFIMVAAMVGVVAGIWLLGEGFDRLAERLRRRRAGADDRPIPLGRASASIQGRHRAMLRR
jgi:hypothetical protein